MNEAVYTRWLKDDPAVGYKILGLSDRSIRNPLKFLCAGGIAFDGKKIVNIFS